MGQGPGLLLKAWKPRATCTPATPTPTHLAPVGGNMQGLPAIAVLGTETGPVFQQQGSRLAKPTGGSDV